MNSEWFIFYPLLPAFGMALAHSLWQICIIALAWKLVTYFFKGSDALIRYNIALASLFALPCTFAVTFFRQLTMYRETVADSLSPAGITAMLPEGQNAAIQLNQPSAGLAAHIEFYSPPIFLVYLIAVMILSARSLAGYAGIKSLLANSVGEFPESWKLRFEKLKEKTGVMNVPVFLSERVTVPMVAGFFKPVILLPVAVFSSLDVRQVEAILLHELYHLKNYDHYINMVQNIIENLFFYHPATWLISYHLRCEREKRIDELVIAVTEPLPYAKALVTLETSRGSIPVTSIAATKSKNQLLSRIQNIMNMKKQKNNLTQKTAGLLVIIISGVFIAWINPYGYENLHKEIHVDINANQDLSERQTQKPGSRADSELDELKALLDENRQFETSPGIITDADLDKEISEQVYQAMDSARKTIAGLDSEELREQMRQAQEEIKEAMKINSDEFRELTLQIQEEVRQALSEADTTELGNELKKALEEMKIEMKSFRSEEFREQMRQAQEEMREAMKNFNSEEFREQMRQAQEEMREAMKNFNSEEFREQMRQAQEEMREAMKNFNSEEFREQMRQARENMMKAIEEPEAEDSGNR
jgi:bla regulator protein blaR1